MSRRAKPFRSRWQPATNTLAIAAEGARVAPNAAEIISNNKMLFGALRSGQMREKAAFDRLTKAILIAENLREFPLAREHGATFEAAFDALVQIANRRQAKSLDHYVATGPELDAIELALDVHAVQVQAASLSEMEHAHARLIAQQMTLQGRAA